MGKLLRAWSLTEKFLVGVLTLTATGFAFTGVVLRYGFSYSPEWLEEMIVYLIIWSVFIIASTLVEERRHVGATFLVELLPPKVRRGVEVITSLLALGFCILVMNWGYKIVHVAYITDERTMTSLRYPLWIFYLSLPVGLTLMTVRYGRRIYRLLFRFSASELREAHEMSRSTYRQKENRTTGSE